MGNSTSLVQSTSTALPQIPLPLEYASVVLNTAVATPSCTATLAATELDGECPGDPSWAATTTLPYLVPCFGCSDLTESISYVECPEQGPPPATTRSLNSTRTLFSPQCSPTPDPSEYYRPDPPSEITTTYPFTGAVVGKPEYTPSDLVITTYAQGYCEAELSVFATYNPSFPVTVDSSYYSFLASLTSSLCATSTVYSATVHVTTSMDCAGCTPLDGLVVGSYNGVYCFYPSTESVPTVTATTATRAVEYVCLASDV